MIRKSKSIEQIYDESRDYDLLITNDAPLATALNKLVDKPRLGYLAMTPKQIASRFARLYYDKIFEKHEVVLKIRRLKNMSLKSIHQSVKKIYEMWMYNAKLEFTEQYLHEDEKYLLNYINEFHTIETAMENFNEAFYGDKELAVIGDELFSLLDLEVLPRKSKPAHRISIFEEGEYEIDRTYVFPSTEQLIQSTLEIVNNENAVETAIVLNHESEYLNILKARFREMGIPIEIKNYLSDEITVRNFISLMETSFRVNELKVNEFISPASLFGINVDIKYGGYDLVNYINHFSKDNYQKKLFRLCREIQTYTYTELIRILKKEFEFTVHAKLSEVIKMLEFDNVKISEDNLLELKYFIKEFDAELEPERSGVLFVNSGSSAFIDRQQIFYIGMDNSWMTTFPDKDYLNKEEEEEKSISRFQILLQQGSVRFYFVRNLINFKEVIPCYYFNILSRKNITGFLDEYFKPSVAGSEKKRIIYKKRAKTIEAGETKNIDYISPTGLNDFYKCPKYYSFRRLLPSEDNSAFKKGRMLHEFAELYFHHPEFVKENLKKVTETMTDGLSLFLINHNREFINSEIILGVESIIGFLDEKQFNKHEIEAEEAVDNSLMQKFKLRKIFSNTEKWLEEKEATKIAGKMDLHADHFIVDYKTTRTRRKEFEVTLQANVDYINLFENEEFDFQAAAYIAALRHKYPEINFIYNFLYNNYKNQIDPEKFREEILTNIKYLPVTFMEYIYSEVFFENCKAKEKEKVKLLEVLNYEDFRNILDKLGLDFKDFFDKEKITNRFREITNIKIKEKNMPLSAFRKQKQSTLDKDIIDPVASMIYSIRIGVGSNGYAFKDDIDKFTELVEEKLKELNTYIRTTFPFKPVFGSRDICKKCNYLNLCIGNKLW